MTTRPTICVLIGSYLPGFKSGGPVRSLVNLIGHLAGDFDFRILTADRDFGDTEPYDGITPDRWVAVGPALVHYTSPALQTLRGLSRLIHETPHDVLYLNSFFSPRWTILPLAARRLGTIPSRPTIVAPRGEFSAGALALHPLKKKAYIAAGGAAGLFTRVTWQASSDFEAQDIRGVVGAGAGTVHVAMNLPASLDAAPPYHHPRGTGTRLRIVFLSRISPTKNLDYALRVLARVNAPVAFTIHGPPEDTAYCGVCRGLIAQLPPHIEVSWRGPVAPASVPAVLAQHDLLFLPTRGENYGHVIAEAMGAGTPVLLSDATPWRGLARSGIGHDLPLDNPARFVEAIEAAAGQSAAQAAGQRARVFDYARERQRGGASVEAHRALFVSAIGSGREQAGAKPSPEDDV